MFLYQVEQHYMFNNIASMLFALAALVLFAMYCYLLQRKHKRPLGELLTWQAIKHNESVFVMMMVAACLAESISAATVLAPGLIPANPLARTSGHLFIGFAGMFGIMTLFKDSAQILFPGSDGVSRFFQFLVVVFLGVLAFGSPILNLILMAGNLKQDLELQLFLFSWTFVTDTEWRNTLAFYGYDLKWSPWAALEPNLKVSFGITFLHFVIAGLEGARSMSTKKRRTELFTSYEEKEEKKEGDKSDDKKKDDKKDEDKDSMKENLKVMLTFFGYSGDDLKDFVDKGYDVLFKISDTSLQGKMGVRTAKLASEVTALEKKSMTVAERTTAEKELKTRIREFFGASKKETDPKKMGLGLTLKAVK